MHRLTVNLSSFLLVITLLGMLLYGLVLGVERLLVVTDAGVAWAGRGFKGSLGWGGWCRVGIRRASRHLGCERRGVARRAAV